VKADELLRAGQLDEAIASLGVELRGNPADVQRRTFLFELLCFAGEHDRAEKQLDVPLSFEGTRAIGATLGSGAVIVLDGTADLNQILLRIARFFKHESCLGILH